MIRGGAGIIQYRDKISDAGEFYESAMILKKATAKYDIPLIINDRLDIALAVEADGIHLGQADLPVDVARKLMNNNMMVGGSLHSISEYEKVKQADYFGVGAVYPTKTKSNPQVSGVDFIREIRIKTTKPIIGIGGITLENCLPVINAGADGVALISAVMGSEDIESSTREFAVIISKNRNVRQ
jgi:thiamine-phosphate pyrophosphorylase